jgi:hypothetical protein
MRALWWIYVSFGILFAAGSLSDRVAAEEVGLASPVFGVGFVLFILIWTLMLSQGIFTRINRALGYLLLNLGFAVCVFFTASNISMTFDVLNAETGNQTPGTVSFWIGFFGALGILLISIVLLAIRRHQGTLAWKILETNKFVSVEPGYQERMAARAAIEAEPSEA